MLKASLTKPLLGTVIQITVNTNGSKVKALDKIEKAFEQFDYVVKHFSRFDEKSELSRLNHANGKEVQVSDDLFTLIEQAIVLSKKTNYLYDPTIIDILNVYGYDRSFNEKRIKEMANKPSLQAEIREVMRDRPKIHDIKLNAKKRTIQLMPKQKIDLGASAKGYAIDLATKVLRESGYGNFLINAGGDIYAAGKKKIALFDPKNPVKPLDTIEIKDEAIAGSGNFAKQVGTFHHIINFNELDEENGIGGEHNDSHGKSADQNEDQSKNQNRKQHQDKNKSHVLQTYVIAPTAMEADMYSTMLFLLGKAGLKLLNEKGYKGIIIKSDI